MMGSREGVTVVVTAFTVFAAAIAHADTVADFYRGKTVTLSVGSGAGGGYDTYARVIARHLHKHIPGEPVVIVKNAPGAGGLVLANTLYNVAAKDGTEIATFNRGLLLDPLLGNDKAQHDPRRFTWLGSPASEVSTCVSWHATGIKTVADVRAKELVIGSTGPTTDTALYAQMSNILLGTKFKLVHGYAGGAEAILAMERGEIQGFCGWAYSSMEAQRPGWLKQGRISVILQYGVAPNPMFPGVPLATDLTTTPRARQMFELAVAPQLFARPFMAPPGVPPDRAAALATAFAAMLRDPDLRKEAAERRLDIEPVTGREIMSVLERVYASPREVIDEVKSIMK